MTSRGRHQGPHTPSGTPVELTLDRPANGGASVGRDENGRVVFADGGLPEEHVRVALDTEKKRFARGRVIEVLEASPDRIVPACPTHLLGCGGCDMAHALPHAQLSIKRQVVADALIRLGRCDPAEVDRLFSLESPATSPVPEAGYRTTVRAVITKGAPGYRRRASHEAVQVVRCGVAHPLVEELLVDGRFEEAAGTEVTFRASVATGERLAVVDGDARSVRLPDDVVVVSRQQLDAGRQVHMTEHAAGRDWQISASSFFQAGPTVATALVDAVARAAGSADGLVVVDAYAGIGLIGGVVGATARSLLSVEQSGSSSRDARVNLAGLPATIIECPVEEWQGGPADLVIADPSRSGLEDAGVNALVRCEADRFVLVSCDTGSLGRDVGLLVQQGYVVHSIEVVDAFPDTSHVETVVGFRR